MTVRDQYLRFWITGVFLSGLLLFLPGITLYILDFFGLTPSPMQPTIRPVPASSD